ncbi:MAG: phosphotransferase [Anaerolineae bacterium]
MSSDTPFDPNYLAEHWPLHEVRLGPVLRVFDERQVQVVSAREGRYVLKTTNQWRDDQDAASHLSLPGFLARHGFAHAPALLPTRAGRLFQPLNGWYAYLLEYVDGRVPDLTPAVYVRMGELLADLHAVPGYPNPYLFTYQEVLPGFYDIARDLPFAEEYLAIVRAWPDFDALPHALIHGEVVGNTLQRDDGRLVVLDWDEAGVGTRLFDVGHPLIQCFVSEALEVRWDLMAAFYRGYLARIRLTELELRHVLDAALFYALRYIVWGDTAARWRRIQWALAHRDALNAVITQAAAAVRPSRFPPTRRQSGV